MFSASAAVYGACSTINIYSVKKNDTWFFQGQAVFNNVTGGYEYPNKQVITFKDFVKEVHGKVKTYSNYTGFFVSLEVTTQSQAIDWFRKCGFKFCRPTYNAKNGTTVQLGIGTVPKVKAKCEKLLKEMEKINA